MILDLLFPKWCLSCQKVGVYLCNKCRVQLEYVSTDGCLYCDKISLSGLTHERCKRKNGIDGIQSFLYYSPVMKNIMKELKYGEVRDAYHEFFWSLSPLIVSKIAFFSRFHEDIYIQPLPLHNRRLQARGFNQAAIFAGYISKLLHIPIIESLQRVKDTPQQARQGSRWQRYINTHNAFQVTKPNVIEGKKVILIDDVITTGSTIKEAAVSLKKSGATHVFALSILRD